MTPVRFIVTLLGSATLAAAGVAGLNAAVDPYGLFNQPRLAGFNAIKPEVDSREALMKSYQARRVQPATVILGSSRTGVGLDPRSAAFPAAMQPVYNLSIAGSDLASSLGHLRNLLAARPGAAAPRTVLVGLDFEAFLYRPKPVAGSPAAPADGAAAADPQAAQADRFAALAQWPDSALPPLPILKDFATATLTLDALLDSLSTVAASRSGKDSANLEDSGHLSEGKLRGWTAADGAARLFLQKNLATVRQLASPAQMLSDSPGGPIVGMVDVQALIQLARQHHMALVLAIQPAHASRMDLLDGLGYWPALERWKRGLVSTVAAAQAAGSDITLWDFAGYERWVQEPVPALGDRSRPMQGFWDPVHYNSTAGDAMLRSMLGGQPEVAGAVRLSPDTLEARLAQVRLDRAAARLRQPAAWASVQKMLCDAGHCSGR